MVDNNHFASGSNDFNEAAKSASIAAIDARRDYDAAAEEVTRTRAEAESARAQADYTEYEAEQAYLRVKDAAVAFQILLNSDCAVYSSLEVAEIALNDALAINYDMSCAARHYSSEAHEKKRQADKAVMDATDKARRRDEAALKAFELTRRVNLLMSGGHLHQKEKETILSNLVIKGTYTLCTYINGPTRTLKLSPNLSFEHLDGTPITLHAPGHQTKPIFKTNKGFELYLVPINIDDIDPGARVQINSNLEKVLSRDKVVDEEAYNYTFSIDYTPKGGVNQKTQTFSRTFRASCN